MGLVHSRIKAGIHRRVAGWLLRQGHVTELGVEGVRLEKTQGRGGTFSHNHFLSYHVEKLCFQSWIIQ